MKKAVTMIELIFVIVILGILASVAVPRLAATREDAEISASVLVLARRGMATLARIPKITITKINSIIVKPFFMVNSFKFNNAGYATILIIKVCLKFIKVLLNYFFL